MSDLDVAGLQQRIHDLEAALGLNNERLSATFQLSPVLSNLMGLLIALPKVTPEAIQQVTSDGRVAIYRLRKQLANWNITIHNRRKVGYWLNDSDKARIRDLLSAR